MIRFFCILLEIFYEYNDVRGCKMGVFLSVIFNFMCRLGLATMLRYFVKHDSGCLWEGRLDEISISIGGL